MLKSRIFWLNFVGIVFLGLILRWNSFSMPFERDEGEYAYSAWLIKSGQGVPYRDSFLQKPPLIIYTYLAGQIIAPKALWAPRFLAFISSLVVTMVLGLILAKQHGRDISIIAMWLVTPMLTFPYFMGGTANCEIFMLAPLMGLLYCFFSDLEKTSLKYWICGGVFSSLSILYKPICLYLIMFVYLIWIIKLGKSNSLSFLTRSGIYTNLFRFIVVTLISGGLTAFLVMLPVILSGAWPYFWEEAVVFNSQYVAMWGWGLGTLFRQLKLIFTQWWFIPVPLIFYFFKQVKYRWIWVGLLLTAMLGVYQSPIGHYYLFLMPYLAVMAAIGLGNIQRMYPKVPLFAIGLISLICLIRPMIRQFSLTPREVNLWIYGSANPFTEAEIVASKLAAITTPQDPVFIGGSEPEILYYAGRKSATRFNITYPLIMDTNKRMDYQKEAIADLTENKPQAVIISQRQFSGLWDESTPQNFIDFLRGLIEKEYRLVGGYLWTPAGDYWLSNLSQKDIAAASLLLYQKI